MFLFCVVSRLCFTFFLQVFAIQRDASKCFKEMPHLAHMEEEEIKVKDDKKSCSHVSIKWWKRVENETVSHKWE